MASGTAGFPGRPLPTSPRTTMTAYLPPPPGASPIIHADDYLIIADKPCGLLSVPGRGEHKADCLLSRLQQEYPDALTVHRLDMSTSGLLVFARGADMHRKLSKMFQDRQVDKRYIARPRRSAAAR